MMQRCGGERAHPRAFEQEEAPATNRPRGVILGNNPHKIIELLGYMETAQSHTL